MSPKHNASLRISSLILRAEVSIPPPEGPARQHRCCTEGIEAIRSAKRSYGKALRKLDYLVPGAIAKFPQSFPGILMTPRMLARTIGQRKVQQWFDWHHQFTQSLNPARDDSKSRKLLWESAEQDARASLKSATHAYNWLEDLSFDLPGDAIISLDDSVKVRDFILEDAINEAHSYIHRTGELVGGIFGCRIKHDGEIWRTECPVSIAHLRFGFSPGMLVRHLCNICGFDPGDCEHVFGDEYATVVAKFEGSCNVCTSSKECEHHPGSKIRLNAFEMYVGLDLQEVSMVVRPRDPLARTTSRGIDDEELIEFFGFLPSSESPLLCHECMFPCAGFRKLPQRS